MNGLGLGRLPKHTSEHTDGLASAANWIKRLWTRYAQSAQRASPPPRLLLVVLLAAQILFLAIVRLGPSASIWTSRTSSSSDSPRSSSFSASLLVGSGARLPALKFLPQENQELSSLLDGGSKPSSSSHSSLSSSSAASDVNDLTPTPKYDDPPSPDEQNPVFQTSSAVVEEEAPPSKKKPISRKKPSSKKKSSSKNPKNKKKTPVVAFTEESSNVPSLDEQKAAYERDSPSIQKIEETPTILESTDDLLPSVEDKLLAEPASNGASLTSSEDKSSSLEERASLLDTSSPTIEDKGVQEGATIVQTEVELSAEAQNEAMTTSFIETKALVAEKTSEAATETEAQSEPVVQEEQAVATERVSESITSTEVQPEKEPLMMEEQALITEKASEAATDAETQSEPVLQEEQAFSAEKVSETVASTEIQSEKESVVKEEQAFSAEKVSETVASTEVQSEKEPLVKEEQALIAEKVREEATVSFENEAQSPPVVKKEQALIAQKVSEVTSSSECGYGYIYVYDLPPIFNHDVIANCTALNPWLDVCPTLLNGGLGESLGGASPLGQMGSWYVSDQFTAEVVFHNRILQHPCLTDKPELASGFYVPYYAGLEVARYLWSGFSAERRDRVSKQMLEWLGEQQAWIRSGGWDHFMMIGRITWDFRRSKDEDWGSGFFYNPAMQNTTRLLIERNPWDDKEMAVPYPTNFHPQSDSDLVAWQNHIRSLKRSSLFSFAGAPRKRFPNDFRGILLEQCQQAESCQSLDCANRTCEDNQKTLELFMNSTFCLQPRGDSFTRRSTFDCLLAGSIPVFFWHRSAYLQYKWHLPADEASYSVFISKEDMRNGTQIVEVLNALSPEKVRSMQEAVIQMIPRIVYAVSGFSLRDEKDAFDVAIEGVMRRFKELSVSSER